MSWAGCSSVCRFLTHSDFDLEINPSTYQAVTDQERLLPFRLSPSFPPPSFSRVVVLVAYCTGCLLVSFCVYFLDVFLGVTVTVCSNKSEDCMLSATSNLVLSMFQWRPLKWEMAVTLLRARGQPQCPHYCTHFTDEETGAGGQAGWGLRNRLEEGPEPWT